MVRACDDFMNSGHNHLVTKIEIFILDLICFAVANFASVFLRNKIMGREMLGSTVMLFLICLAHAVVAIITDAYHRFLVRNKSREFLEAGKHVLITFSAALVIGFLAHIEMEFSRLALGIMLILSFMLIYVARLIAKTIRRKHFESSEYLRNMMVVTTSDHVEKLLNRIGTMETYDYKIEALTIVDKDVTGQMFGGIPVMASREDVVSYITSHPIDEVLVSVFNDSEYVAELTDTLLGMGLSVDADIEDMWENYPNARLVCLGESNHILASTHSYMSDLDALIKRGMDIAGGLVGLLICGILTIFVGPFIFFASPGPIFFKQTRVGLNGRKFMIYKFRSMYMDAEERKKELMAQNEMGGHMFKMTDDPRIIKGVGHFIRKTSIDEFPQFVNVLKGDMSLVGTRPPTEDEYEKYEPHHKARLSMKPGLTGLWQVSGRSAITDFDDVVKLDKAYIMNWSLKKDFEIILKTVKVVLLRSGAR